MSLKIITTEDGSHSLYDERLNETYHSTRGALGESMHVFIKEGLEHWLAKNRAKKIRILEVGLGTALNALLTAQYAESHQVNIHFTTLEPFPIKREIYEKLSFTQDMKDRELLLKMHELEWEHEIKFSSHFTLYKKTQKLEQLGGSEKFDLIFFDAFAPSKQPDVWSLENIQKCYRQLESGGMLTTYCAQGQFKRDLMEAGFQVETLQGAMGKKEMVRAIKINK